MDKIKELQAEIERYKKWYKMLLDFEQKIMLIGTVCTQNATMRETSLEEKTIDSNAN